MLSAILASCKGGPSVADGFPSQRTSNADFDVLFIVSNSKVVCYMKVVNYEFVWVCVPLCMLLSLFSLLCFPFYYSKNLFSFSSFNCHGNWKKCISSWGPNKLTLQCSCYLSFQCISYATIIFVQLSWVERAEHEQAVEQAVALSVVRVALALMWRNCDAMYTNHQETFPF